MGMVYFNRHHSQIIGEKLTLQHIHLILSSAQGSYDDGIFFYFGDKQPQHVTVQMRTENPDIESCDLRLTSINQNVTFFFNKLPWQDVAFFRFGYFNYMKLNLVSMVQKFTNDTWYQVDLLVDWSNQAVTVYVDNQLQASDIFFTNQKSPVNSANAVVLYNLSPGSTCQIKNLKICDTRCKGGESLVYAFAENLKQITITMGVIISIALWGLV